MFDVGLSELIVIGVVMLLAIGPKELPETLRTIGRFIAQVKRMASDARAQFDEALREPAAVVEREVDSAKAMLPDAEAWVTHEIDLKTLSPTSSEPAAKTGEPQ